MSRYNLSNCIFSQTTLLKDAEDRIKRARRAREKFYNEEAYKASYTIVNLVKTFQCVGEAKEKLYNR